VSVRSFGQFGATEILEVTLATDAGAEARVITWGAVLRDLVVPARSGRQRVVLGLDRLDHYVEHSPNFGAILGRYANRIGDARFRLEGHEVRLAANDADNELHGGPRGFGKRPWSLLGHDRRTATLALLSDDDDQGFPGRLFATCTYELQEPATLRVTLQAFAEDPTPVNLSTHSYWNLDGTADVRSHRLQLNADFITPTDAELIPTGEIAAVAGTPFDFRSPRPIRRSGADPDYDINFVLRRERSIRPELAHAATLSSEISGVAMELWTTEPGLQVYDGHKVNIPVPGLGGQHYGPYAGAALEPQRFPDGPNRSYFPSCILEPGHVSRQVSEMRFTAPGG
jgi:aldose 1-epimerase